MKNEINTIAAGLARAVILMDKDEVVSLANTVKDSGLDVNIAITAGLTRGMEETGLKYEQGEYFLPEILMAYDAMKAGMNILRPGLKVTGQADQYSNPRVVIGVMEGDFHEIGKDLVKLMLEVGGFEVTDLGRDVPITKFVQTAAEQKAGLLCLSSLISTSMLGMPEVIQQLETRELRQQIKVMIGGACVTADYARQIGADGYADNAAAALRQARLLMLKNNHLEYG